MPSVLFVCTANQFRSPIAAACFLKSVEKENTAKRWIVESAGTWTREGIPVPKMTLQVASQLGLNGLYRHLTQQIDQRLLNRFDLIVVMEMGHKEALASEFPSVCRRLYLLSEIADGISYDIPDPADPGIDPDHVGHELQRLITKGKEKLLQLAKALSKSQSL